jgi:hypothetical protein
MSLLCTVYYIIDAALCTRLNLRTPALSLALVRSSNLVNNNPPPVPCVDLLLTVSVPTVGEEAADEGSGRAKKAHPPLQIVYST